MFQKNIQNILNKEINFEGLIIKINLALVFISIVTLYLELIGGGAGLMVLISGISFYAGLVFVPILIIFGLKNIFIDKKTYHGIVIIGLGVVTIITYSIHYIWAL